MEYKKDLFGAWIEAQAKMPFWRTVLAAVLTSVILVGGYVFTAYISHEAHRVAQYDENLYKIVISCDLISFVMYGGNPVGYQNYFKWNYAKWRNDLERTWLEKFLFWNKGIFYDASNPSAEYQYQFLGTKN